MIIENYSQSKREKMCLYLIYNILASSSKITTPRANTRAFHAHLSHFEINRLSRPKASRVPNSFNMFFSRSSNFLLLLCGISNVCFTCATASSIQTFLPDVVKTQASQAMKGLKAASGIQDHFKTLTGTELTSGNSRTLLAIPEGYVCTVWTALGTCGSIFSKLECSSETLCDWDDDDASCGFNSGEGSYIASVLATYTSSIESIGLSCLSSSTCSDESCTMHDSCVPNFEGLQKASPGTAASNYFFAESFKCLLGFETQTTCDSDDAPNCEWQQDSDDGTWECGLSSHALGLLLYEAGRECDFEEPSAADMTASEYDLCSYYEADAKCSGLTTQLSCSLDPDCKWDLISEDPFDTLYPCSGADGKVEQASKLAYSDMSAFVNLAYECHVHSSKADCIEDVECSWSYAAGSGTTDEACSPNDIKVSKYYEHPHVAAAAQIQKVCSGVSQDECGSGTTAGKCQWAEASSGGDAECIYDREYSINAMSCTCPQLTELLEEEGISADSCTPSPPPPASPAPPPSEFSTSDSQSLKTYASFLAAVGILLMLAY